MKEEAVSFVKTAIEFLRVELAATHNIRYRETLIDAIRSLEVLLRFAP